MPVGGSRPSDRSRGPRVGGTNVARHATPRHATPRHATPRHATDGAQKLLALLTFVAVSVHPGDARADDYDDYCDSYSPQWGWGGSGEDCDGGQTYDVCYLLSGGRIECDLSVNEDDPDDHSPAWLVAVFDHSGGLCGSSNYCIWGVDVDGDDFRCSFSSSSKTEVGVLGGKAADNIWLTYNETWDLREHTDSSAFVGRIGPRDGDDVVIGSRRVDADYTDILNGDDGQDLICAREGDDQIDGGNHGDTLLGQDGNDTILGMGGDDQACGNDGTDALVGGNGNDNLWTGSSSESAAGGDGFDYCSPDGDGTCNDIITIGENCAI